LLLWICAAPLPAAALLSLPAGHFPQFIAAVIGLALLALAWVLARHDATDTPPSPRSFVRPWWRRWRWATLNLAGLAVAAATASIAGIGLRYSPEIALAFAAVALVGFHLVYGFEPWWVRRLDLEPLSPAIAATLAAAEERLAHLDHVATAITAPELAARLRRIAALGRDILVRLAARPAEVQRARRFLAVFIEGAERVSEGYARAQRQGESGALEADFRALLIAIEDHFHRQREQLQDYDIQDLDLQIEVLQRQLARENVAARDLGPHT